MIKTGLLLMLSVLAGSVGQAQQHSYQDKALPIEKRVDDLLGRMTLEEKIGQLNLLPYYEKQDAAVRSGIKAGKVGALLKANGVALNESLQREAVENSRLQIPLMFHEDVIHGYRTITPIPLAEACSWDLEAIRRSAEVAAKETSASGIQLTYAPMVDISVDPRWGRIMETSGEDSWLGAQIAIARVKGFQGDGLASPATVMACVKHFAGYGSTVAGLDYTITNFSERDLFETYLPPFEAAIKAGAGSVMCAYTPYDGVPLTVNKYMNTDVLRDILKFDGLLMTDWNTFNHAVTTGASENGKSSAEKGIKAGLDMDMTSGQYSKNLLQLVQEKKVPVELIDNAARNALIAKYKVGLMDDPYLYFNAEREKKVVLSPEVKDGALDMAVKSMVLLKNDKQVLPLASQQAIALVGPFATNQQDLLGSWSALGKAGEVISVEQGIVMQKKKQTRLNTLGCKLDGVNDEYIRNAVNLARNADVVVACIGEPAAYIGESVSSAKITVPDEQIRLLEALKATGKPVVAVLFNGRPLIVDEILKNSDALLEAWYPGTMGGQAVARILYGDHNPSGKLVQTFPRHVGQIPSCYNGRRTFYGIDHCDVEKGPQFPFGYGLSYTQFTYSDPKVNKTDLSGNEPLQVSIRVKNTGKYAGREVVQLYIRDLVAQVVPREKELKGFSGIELQPGEEKEVHFTLTPDDLKYYDPEMNSVFEPGQFKIMVGTNSADTKEVLIRYQ